MRAPSVNVIRKQNAAELFKRRILCHSYSDGNKKSLLRSFLHENALFSGDGKMV